VNNGNARTSGADTRRDRVSQTFAKESDLQLRWPVRVSPGSGDVDDGAGFFEDGVGSDAEAAETVNAVRAARAPMPIVRYAAVLTGTAS
jgi:hypothetical protein